MTRAGEGGEGTRKPPRLYAIADSAALSSLGLGLARGAVAMMEGGVRWVQLRGKDMTSGDFYRQAAEVVEAAAGFGARVLVNDRADVALACGADGVHLGQEDLDPADARMLLGPGALLGWSTHDLGQGLGSRRLPLDYVAVGPVAPTTGKRAVGPVVGPDLLAALRGALEVPIVAIGGIRRETAARHLGRGADSVAVIGDLMREGDPREGVRRFLGALEDLPA